MELKDSILNLQWEALTFRRKLNKLIRNLPDNPNIKRIPGTNHAFTMNFSEIMKDKRQRMSAEYYDFKYQYERVREKLKTSDPLNWINVLESMVTDGKFVRPGSKEVITLHPEVIKKIKQIIFDGGQSV